MAGISAIGAYIPRLRLSRKLMTEANAWFNPGLKPYGKGERAVANWDEDVVTMAVEVARGVLGKTAGTGPGAIYLASTTAPFAVRQNAGIVAEALGAAGALRTMDVGASQRAGTTALLAAFDTALARKQRVLVLAGEKRHSPAGSVQEMTSGDAAVAVLVEEGDGIARLVAQRSTSVDFVDHYRAQGREFDYGWEERWIREEGYLKLVPPVIAGVLVDAGVSADAIHHFCMPCTLSRVPQAVAKKAGIADDRVRGNLDGVCGDTGAAHALLMLAQVLETAKPGERILVIGFGQGVDALLFEVTAGIDKARPDTVASSLAARKELASYSRFLAFNDLVKLERGLRAEADKQTPLTTLYRNRDMILGLVGGRCERCGTIQFPKAAICVNPACGASGSQVDQPFADFHGRIQTWSADQLTYCPDPPAHYGMVQFDEGGRMTVDFTDVDVGAVDVGMPMRMVFRIKEVDSQRGFVRYFWKAAPVSAAIAA